MAEDEARRARGGGRAGNRRRSGSALQQIAWSLPENPDRPTEPLTPERVEAIHNGAMRVLEEIGIDFLHPEAVAILKDAGCRIGADGTRVYFDRAFVMDKVRQCPSTFTITPRNPERQITIGGKAMVFGNVASPPNYSSLETERRPGDRAAFQDFIRLTQSFNCLHFLAGYPVEAVDIHASTRHLDSLFDMLTLSDKVCHAYSLGTERISDGMEMVRIAGGLTKAEFEATPRMFTNINSSSPLKHDWPMLDGAMRMARANQAVVITPFTLAGAMAPVTLVGAVTLSIAEALAGVALLQTIRPGAPVAYGSFTSNVDMKSGAPAFGTPEYLRATQISGQMARYYGLPLRASNACAANSPDAQAAWESAFSLWACVSSGTNMVYHAAGWLEGGLCANFEKFVMDCETLQQVIHYLKDIPASDDDIGVDAIAEVGPTGHFFGVGHTQSRYQTAFYSPFLSDWRNFESWTEGGRPTAIEHANRVWKQVVADFEPPPMDIAIREELDAFITRRRLEGGAPTDF